MSHKVDTPSDDLRTSLARSLGFLNYPANATAEPYLIYIVKTCGGNLEDYLELFIAVVDHFQTHTGKDDSIRALLDQLALAGFRSVFVDTSVGDVMRRQHVEDTVLCILGAWTTMLSSFQLRCRSRKVTAAYNVFANAATPPRDPYDDNISGLIQGSELLPGGQWDHRKDLGNDAASKLMMILSNPNNATRQSSLQSLLMQPTGHSPITSNIHMLPLSLLDDADFSESLSIKAIRLNAFKLNLLGAIDILWTPNLSRHMLLTKLHGRHVLELFSLPCVFSAVTTPRIGVSAELTTEMEESYAMLFNAWPERPLHVKLGANFGIRRWCWCLPCSGYRYREACIVSCKRAAGADTRHRRSSHSDFTLSHYDSTVYDLMKNQSMKDWTPDDFPHLWLRIVRLEQHLQTARPWSIWVLFRDKRDTVQFWTFLFATVVVFLTIAQVLLGVAQVVGSFI